MEKAQECLEQSGYDGEELVILVEAEDELNKGAQVLQNCLLAVGINTTITAVESALYTTYRYDPAQYDIQLMTSGCSDLESTAGCRTAIPVRLEPPTWAFRIWSSMRS